MNNTQTDNQNQQYDYKSINQPAKGSTVSTQKGSNNKTETSEGSYKKPSEQRKPQFRLKENMKRRFH